MANNLFSLLLILFLSPEIKPQGLTLKIGDTPPKLDFTMFHMAGTDSGLTWQDLNGTVVIIDFWATWCTPCIKSFPHLNKLVKEFAEKPVAFLSITYEPPHMIKPFFSKYILDTTIGIDNDFAMFKSYKAWAIPMVVIVNQKGRIASIIHPNYLTKEIIKEVLAGKIPEVKQTEGWSDPEGAEEYFRSTIESM